MVRAQRIGLVIGPDADPSIGTSIQGPSVIRTPPWVDEPLGTYLCYFADHIGDHIRLAFADEISGPWTIVPGGCLSLAESHFLTAAPSVTDQEAAHYLARYDQEFGGYETVDIRVDLTEPHIASPDVRIDASRHRIELWYHGLDALGHQVTRYATSTSGVDFTAQEPTFDGTYLRVFSVAGQDYGLAMPGRLLKRVGGPTEFERGPSILPPTSRHMAAWVDGDQLRVFYTEVGDAPERIKMVSVDVRGPWTDWAAGEPVEVLRPEEPWEGACYPLEPSIRGHWPGRANQLRDPAIFVDSPANTQAVGSAADESGLVYLFYAVAAESGIAVAQIIAS